MKKFVAILTVCLIAAPAFAGYKVKISRNADFADGGSFGLTFATDAGYTGAVDPAKLMFGDRANPGSNDGTFCIEDVAIKPNVWYDYTVDDTIIYGANGQDTVLNADTKNIFAHYVDGNLDGVSFLAGASDTGVIGHIGGDSASADQNIALQALLWDGQNVNHGITLTQRQQDIYDAYVDYTTNNIHRWADNVKVLNLWSHDDGSDVQSQLTIVTVPAPGAIVLGMMGVGLVGWARRRFA